MRQDTISHILAEFAFNLEFENLSKTALGLRYLVIGWVYLLD